MAASSTRLRWHHIVGRGGRERGFPRTFFPGSWKGGAVMPLSRACEVYTMGSTPWAVVPRSPLRRSGSRGLADRPFHARASGGLAEAAGTDVVCARSAGNPLIICPTRRYSVLALKAPRSDCAWPAQQRSSCRRSWVRRRVRTRCRAPFWWCSPSPAALAACTAWA